MKPKGFRTISKTLLSRAFVVFAAIALLCSSFVQPQHSQSTSEQGLVEKGAGKDELHQALIDLTNPWTVMCVAAHPDDEDGSTLIVLRRKYGIHTVSLFSTYGEGGQNAVGPELYEELGVIRARETMAAAAVQGSEPHFLGLQDFGFSKSAEETFRAWGERETLRRMVFQIRKLRPDAIITNHNTTGGHGHHQVTGRLVLQAFDAAADPTQFPEQLSQVKPWQVQRLFVRGGRSDSTNQTTPQAQITIDPNEMDPIRGETYAQQALRGLQQHATQGPWPKTLSPTGGRISRYSLVKSASTAAPLPENAKTPVDGLQLPEAIRSRFTAPTIDDKPMSGFAGNRTEVLIALINARRRGAFTAAKEVFDLDPERFRLMSSRLDTALAKAAGISVIIKTSEEVLVPNEKSRFVVTLSNSGDEEVKIKRWTSNGLPVVKQLDPADKLLPGTETFQELTAATPKNSPITVPSAEHLYDGRLFGIPFGVEAELEIEGVRFTVSNEKKIDVAPAVEIVNNKPTPCVETPATLFSCESALVTLTNKLTRPFHGVLQQTQNLGGREASTNIDVNLKVNESRMMGREQFFAGTLREALRIARQNGNLKSTLIDSESKEKVNELTVPIVYIPAIAPAGLRVGYIPSTDQTLQQSLKALGVQATELQVENVSTDLSAFDTIIIDNRGYEIHPELIKTNDKLLKFVEDGGTLIVFYHKTNEWNPDERKGRPQLAPYTIIVDDERVTDETAPVRFLQPGHRLLNFPNKITQRDFEGWIQERGLYFPKEWDSHYTAILSTNDKGEPPLNAGLLVAKYGKGNYIHTSMVWYRQLRAGVPGGYRVFANLISYGSSGAGAARSR
jgi:LmbE family N-acetylglucosaminyl deacetylase